jgi:hypothetical protein
MDNGNQKFSFESIVQKLKGDAISLTNFLENKRNFSSNLNAYPAAIKSLRETLALIREYDWNLQYSEYETQGHKEIAIWEQNGQGQIRNHKHYVISPIASYLFKGKRLSTGETVCGCYMPDEYTKTGNAVFGRGGEKYVVDPATVEPCTQEEADEFAKKKTEKLSEPAHVSYGVI